MLQVNVYMCVYGECVCVINIDFQLHHIYTSNRAVQDEEYEKLCIL